jgi:hypothetical protein
MSGKRRDLTGERFGRLTVLAFAGNAREGERQAPVGMWMCRCECGTEKPIKGANLYRGLIQSCGCFRRERFAKLGAQTRTHGHTVGKKSPGYISWAAMCQRCLNVKKDNYRHYGGRGITVCARWLHGEDGKSGFECFLEDMGPRPDGHEIDRIDNNGDYEPSNCRWATRSMQLNNKRNNNRVTMAGEIHTVTEWCRDLGVTPNVLFNHLINQYISKQTFLDMTTRI